MHLFSDMCSFLHTHDMQRVEEAGDFWQKAAIVMRAKLKASEWCVKCKAYCTCTIAHVNVAGTPCVRA